MMQEKGYMVTGSADKTVKVWKAGKCEHTLKGSIAATAAVCVCVYILYFRMTMCSIGIV